MEEARKKLDDCESRVRDIANKIISYETKNEELSNELNEKRNLLSNYVKNCEQKISNSTGSLRGELSIRKSSMDKLDKRLISELENKKQLEERIQRINDAHEKALEQLKSQISSREKTNSSFGKKKLKKNSWIDRYIKYVSKL